MRHGVLSVVPTPRPQRGTPFAPRGPEGPFPRFNATMEHCDFLTVFSPRFVSFAWRYLGASAFRPRSAADAGPTDHPGVCCTGCSRSGFLQGAVGTSHVPVKPVRSFAMFLRPRCDLARLWVQVWLMPGSAPATDHDEGSRQVVISGLNHTAFDLAVYASQWRSPAPTQDSLPGCWPGSAGRDWLPAGFQRKVSHFEMILLSRASWRNVSSFFEGK